MNPQRQADRINSRRVQFGSHAAARAVDTSSFALFCVARVGVIFQIVCRSAHIQSPRLSKGLEKPFP